MTEDAMIKTPVFSKDKPLVPKLGSEGDPRSISSIQLTTESDETELVEHKTPPHNYTGLEYKGTPPHPPGTEPVDAKPIEPPPDTNPPEPEVDPESRRSRRR